jgi:hypothetical protein
MKRLNLHSAFSFLKVLLFLVYLLADQGFSFVLYETFFSADVISPEVLGVSVDTRLLGRQYGVPRDSPFCLPHALPVFTSFQSSWNQRFSEAPLAVFLTAIMMLF